MRQIQVKELTNDNFRKYGQFYSITAPTGNHLGDFFQDKVLAPNGSTMPAAFSSYVVRRTDRMVVTAAEYHDMACEVMLPMDGDVVIHVAPPSKEPVPQETEAFRVPKGTVVKLDAGVWHQESFTREECVHILIVLPQRTYKTDCTLIPYEEKDQIEIVWEN